MQIILSTRNPSKAEQVKAIFAGSGVEILTLEEANIPGEGKEEAFLLEENALIKAMFARRAKPEIWAMADDTGLFIDALNGRPGALSARWAGETATTEEITGHTLKQLEDVTDRQATFVTVVALVAPAGYIRFFKGSVEGAILKEPRCPPQPKMPYSPIFVPDGEEKVWAEMTTEYENSISHRGKAFRKARAFLEKISLSST